MDRLQKDISPPSRYEKLHLVKTNGRTTLRIRVHCQVWTLIYSGCFSPEQNCWQSGERHSFHVECRLYTFWIYHKIFHIILRYTFTLEHQYTNEHPVDIWSTYQQQLKRFGWYTDKTWQRYLRSMEYHFSVSKKDDCGTTIIRNTTSCLNLSCLGKLKLTWS